MSIFGDLDVASAEENPFDVAAGTYRATVTDVKVGPTKDESKVGMTLEYTISDPDSPMYERKVSEWKHIPRDTDVMTDAERGRALSFLKQRMLNLGIPESRMNDVDREDLIGIDCVITVKKNGEYTNVTKVAADV